MEKLITTAVPSASTYSPLSASKSPTLPPPPPPSTPSVNALELPGEDDPAWATGRGASSSLRNRRRSRAHFAGTSTQGPADSISSTVVDGSGSPSSPSSPPSSIIHPADADLTLPLLSPGAAASATTARSPDWAYYPHQPKSLSGIAVRSLCLGAALATGVISAVAILALTTNPLWRLPFFLAALAAYHFLEFWATAAYNTRGAEVASFLLTANWPGYALAHAAATLECLVVNTAWPSRAWAPFHTGPLLVFVGLLLVLAGQAVRTAAMVQAGPSFNHLVQSRRRVEHVLVTTGVYGVLRHPSYFGFFWWALGTQLVLGNAVCFFVYAAVLWRFFSTRVRQEEEFLVRFFGDEYVDYRKTVGTKIPFVP